MNENLARLVQRLETTKIPRVEGTLRDITEDNEVRMCPLGHLVDLYIEDTEGARWDENNNRTDHYFDPNNQESQGNSVGFPTDETLAHFGLVYKDASQIYRMNDQYRRTPAQVAQFIREEIAK